MTPAILALSCILCAVAGLALGFLLGQAGMVPRADREELETLEREAVERYRCFEQSATEPLREVFRGVSATQLQAQGSALRSEQGESLDRILRPYRESLAEFTRKVEEFQKNNTANSGELKGQLDQLRKSAESIGADASRLKNVLTISSKTLGNLSESLLQRALRDSGLAENVEYFLQKALDGTETGEKEGDGRLIPDCVLILPGSDTRLVIDSKANLKYFYEYAQLRETDPEEAPKLLAAHLKSMKGQIDSLARKNYPAALRKAQGCTVLDEVLMFVPSDAVLFESVHADSNLVSYAADKNILLIGPMNLAVCIKTIQLAWGSVKLRQDVQLLLEASDKLLENVDRYKKAMDDAERAIRNAQESLKTARNRILPTSTGKKATSVLDAACSIPRLAMESGRESPDAEE